VLKNKAIDDWRKRRVLNLAAVVPEPGPPVAGPAELAELSIALANCWREIKRMPLTRQVVAFLIWNEGWSTARVAEHLSIAPSTARGHLREARRQLRSSIGHMVPFIEDEEYEVRKEGNCR
jgi:RNA polymerase sigma-70 factor (ECF subfamily)